MTTLNAKANAAYHALIDEYEREHPDGVWLGFDHQRDAYEQGWEDGHEARAVVDREALRRLMVDALNAYVKLGPQGYYVYVDSMLALLNGTQS